MACFVLGCFLKVRFLRFFSKQGTEKAEGSGENEAQKEDSEDTGDLSESQEKNVSVCSVTVGLLLLSLPELLHGARNCAELTAVREKGHAEGVAVRGQLFSFLL